MRASAPNRDRDALGAFASPTVSHPQPPFWLLPFDPPPPAPKLPPSPEPVETPELELLLAPAKTPEVELLLVPAKTPELVPVLDELPPVPEPPVPPVPDPLLLDVVAPVELVEVLVPMTHW